MHTEYITHSGHRKNIEAMQPVRDQLVKEGWTIEPTKVYPDVDNRDRDYLVILIHRDFKV